MLSKEEQEKILSLAPQRDAFNYQWKIKRALDPNDLGDRYYRTLEPKK